MEGKAVAPTLPTFGHSTVYVYPTISPRVVVVPILSCIFGFPVLVLLVICGLRYRARRARTAAKKAHGVELASMELTSGPPILSGRCSNGKGPRLKKRKKKTLVRFKPMPEIDLDTVVEEKSEFDAEVTASDLLTTPEELVIPEENTPASFRAYRYMGVVHSPMNPPQLRASPLRSPQASPNPDHLKEENKEMTMEVREGRIIMSDGAGSPGTDQEDSLSGKEGSHKGAGEIVVGSSGSSDSDTAACFSLSPRQVTKSPTAVHLALKKLDGVMKRRHSSPVKVNLAKKSAQQQQQQTPQPQPKSSAKRSNTVCNDRGIKKNDCDYIDRELMPDISPRSNTVKYRRPSSFSNKRRGESLKVKAKPLSRSNPHVLSVPDGRPGGQESVCGSETESVQNRLSRCDFNNSTDGEDDEEPSGDISITVNNDTESAATRGCSTAAAQGEDAHDHESPKVRLTNSPRTSCHGESVARDACRLVALTSENEVLRYSSNSAVKHRQEDGQVVPATAAAACGIRVDADAESERSTLV